MKVLMVCLGNICRSPLAEGVLRSKVSDKVYVDSAGTITANVGQQPDRRSLETAQKHGLDISKHRARVIEKSDFEAFDLIYCMDLKNLEDVVSLAGNEQQRNKVSLILDVLDDAHDIEIPDPYWGDMDDFEEVYQTLDKACTLIAKKIDH